MFKRRLPRTCPGPLARPAFTMVELLVVLLILTALAAMVVGVGRYHSQEQDRKLTASYQAIVLTAIQKYADRTGDIPHNPLGPGVDALGNELLYIGAGVSAPPGIPTIEGKNIWIRNALMYMDLEQESECMLIVDQLPHGAVMRGELGQPAAFTDAYGKYMDYEERGAFGGPLLISGGPDGYIGRLGDSFSADDIRSDGRVLDQ